MYTIQTQRTILLGVNGYSLLFKNKLKISDVLKTIIKILTAKKVF